MPRRRYFYPRIATGPGLCLSALRETGIWVRWWRGSACRAFSGSLSPHASAVGPSSSIHSRIVATASIFLLEVPYSNSLALARSCKV